MDAEFIDGNPVTRHVVRFKDRAQISDIDAEAVKDGAVIVWIVRTRCQPPSYHPIGHGSDERYRFNVQTVEAAAVVHGDLRDGALAYLDDPTQTQGRLIFGHPTYEAEETIVDLYEFGNAEPVGTITMPPGPEPDSDDAYHHDTAKLPDVPDDPQFGSPDRDPIAAIATGDILARLEATDTAELEADEDGTVHVVGSVYGAAGSRTQDLLNKWDELP